MRIRDRMKIFRICLLVVFFAVLASSTPPPDTPKAQTTVSLPRNYCSADVASLGTGLAQTSDASETRTGLPVYRRWTGWIRAAAYGNYEFSLPVSGGRIFVNQKQIYSRTAMSTEPAIIQIHLLTNRFYAITVEMLGNDVTTLPLHWRRPDGRYEIIPKVYLYAPVATVRSEEKNMTNSKSNLVRS